MKRGRGKETVAENGSRNAMFSVEHVGFSSHPNVIANPDMRENGGHRISNDVNVIAISSNQHSKSIWKGDASLKETLHPPSY